MKSLFKRIHNEHWLGVDHSILRQAVKDMSVELCNHVWEETVDVMTLTGPGNLWDEIHFQVEEDHEAS